jgi:hypothetical protein
VTVKRKGNGWGFVVDLPRGADGKRCQVAKQGYRTKAEATEAERAVLREAADFTADGPNRTIQDFMESVRFPARAAMRKASTVQADRSLAEGHLYPAARSRKVRGLRPRTSSGSPLRSRRRTWHRAPSGVCWHC